MAFVGFASKPFTQSWSDYQRHPNKDTSNKRCRSSVPTRTFDPFPFKKAGYCPVREWFLNFGSNKIRQSGCPYSVQCDFWKFTSLHAVLEAVKQQKHGRWILCGRKRNNGNTPGLAPAMYTFFTTRASRYQHQYSLGYFREITGIRIVNASHGLSELTSSSPPATRVATKPPRCQSS